MKRSYDKEMMDSPQPRELLEEDLKNLRVFNRYFGGYRSVIAGLGRLIEKEQISRFSLLDVGTGSGDIAARIIHWARQRNIEASIVALDPDPVTARVAATLTKQNPPFIPHFQSIPSSVIPAKAGIQREKEKNFQRSAVSIIQADGIAPPFRPGSFDFVLASQLMHHFPEDKILMLLRTWSKLARRAIIISDLVRHPIAYHGIRLITKAYTRNIMTLTDAPLSVHRAFTLPEWRELFRRADVGPFQILPVFPFRIVALLSVSTHT